MSKDRELLAKTVEKTKQYKQEMSQLKSELANSSAMFLEGKDKTLLTMKNKEGKDVQKTVVVKPLGTREAVAETRRIIERRLKKVRQEFQVTEVKYNRQRGKNERWKQQVNTMRKEAVVFDGLFDKMCDELQESKDRLHATQEAIEQAYAARDAARIDAQGILDLAQKDRVHAMEEFEALTKALHEADVPMTREHKTTAGQLTSEEEEQLKQKIVDTAWKIQEFKSRLAKAKTKAAAFEEAIEVLKDETGYEDLTELSQHLVACEDLKFEKASAVSRLIMEVEALEKEIDVLRSEYKTKQLSDAQMLQQSSDDLMALHERLQTSHELFQRESKAAEEVRSELAAILPQVSDLFYAAGCHTVFDEAFVPSSSLRERSVVVRVPKGGAGEPLRGILEPPPDHGDDEGDLSLAVDIDESADEGASEGKSPTQRRTSAQLLSPGGDSPKSRARRSPVKRMSSAIYVGDANPSSTPSARRSLAMRMFSRIPSFRHVIDEGVNQHTLSQFMSVLDQRVAELVQFFAYLAKEGKLKVQQAGISSPASTFRKAAAVLSSTVPLVGPSAPTGVVAQSLTSSAMLASMLSTNTVNRACSADADESRPLTLAEMRNHAAQAISNSEFESLRKASQDAARVISESRQK
jgi:hypothetical protein